MFYLKSSRRRQRAMVAALVVTALAIWTVLMTQPTQPSLAMDLNHTVWLDR